MKKVVLFDIDYTLFNTSSYKSSALTSFEIYEEVIDVLTKVGEVALIGIFSEGEINHQLSKLIKTDIIKHFHDENIHIFTKKLDGLSDVILQYKDKKLYFIDDRLDVLQGIKASDPAIFTIWIKRGEHAELLSEILGFQPDAEVLNLQEIIQIIMNT